MSADDVSLLTFMTHGLTLSVDSVGTRDTWVVMSVDENNVMIMTDSVG